MMVNLQEIELLAQILQRAPVLPTEIMFINDLLGRLRVLVSTPPKSPEPETDGK